MDHAPHPPDVEQISHLHLPLTRHGRQITLLHRGHRVEGHQQVDEAPAQPEQQQGATVAQRDVHGVVCGQPGLQEVTGAQEEQRHREAAQLVDGAPQPEIEGVTPEGGIEGVAEGGDVNGHHGQDGQYPPALDAGDAHDSSWRLEFWPNPNSHA
ncbi:hypothetical protein D3C79_655230 [compost metagenome]